MTYSISTASVNEVIRGVCSLDEAIEGYLKGRMYYDGDPKEIFGNDKIARELEATGEGYTFRLSKTPVDVMADRVKINSVTAGDSEDLQLGAIREANQMDIWEGETIKNSFIYGDGYIFVTPVAPDDMDESPEVRAAGVRITKLDVMSTRAVYDDLAQDPVFVIRSSVIGSGATKRRIVEVYYQDGVAVWITNPGIRDFTKPQNWSPYSDGEIDGTYLYPFTGNVLPIFHLRGQTFTDSPYGKPEHFDAYGPQNAINNALITMISTTKTLGYPQRYALKSFDGDQQFATPATLFEEETNIPELPGRDSKGVTFGPGTVSVFDGMSAVGQFTSADPQVFLVQVAEFKELMAQLTGTPSYAFTAGEDVSGLSRQMEDAKLKMKVESRETRLGSTWQKVYRFVLQLAGFAATPVQVKWKNAGIAVDSDTWSVVAQKQSSGVPVAVSLREAGYEPTEIEAWNDDDQNELTLLQRLQYLEELSKSKDLLTPEQLAQLVAEIMGTDPVVVDISDPTEVLDLDIQENL